MIVKLIAVMFMSLYTFACTGDCIACHPVLKKSIDKPHHKVLKRCIECHKENAGPQRECGADCFDCHDKNKLVKSNIPEHRAVKKCFKCHIDKKEFRPFMQESPTLGGFMEEFGKSLEFEPLKK
ncbi:hypothetical protein [Nitrosophilus alvini]|uniref:hypothetical protein n=1 Tax=Nitrosophilus alvini TaxID=2714855 RepID=UPI0019095CA1|nr:hypothetical protein [Nitrosophilus alvini]